MKRTTWFRVKAPQRWHPKMGDELIGTYEGSKTRIGKYGEYIVHFVKSSRGLYFYVSGAICNDLFTLVETGACVKLIYAGTKKSAQDHEYKVYELYTEEAIKLQVVA